LIPRGGGGFRVSGRRAAAAGASKGDQSRGALRSFGEQIALEPPVWTVPCLAARMANRKAFAFLATVWAAQMKRPGTAHCLADDGSAERLEPDHPELDPERPIAGGPNRQPLPHSPRRGGPYAWRGFRAPLEREDRASALLRTARCKRRAVA
jgi:hypothetical protein